MIIAEKKSVIPLLRDFALLSVELGWPLEYDNKYYLAVISTSRENSMEITFSKFRILEYYALFVARKNSLSLYSTWE